MPENRNRPALNRWHVVILVYICFIYGNSLTPASISSQESGFLLEKVRGAMESLGWEHLSTSSGKQPILRSMLCWVD